jgi:guanylate kinase
LNSKAAPLPLPRRGLMLVLSSPSGAGKTTLSRLLLETDRDIGLSISVTTRPRRQSEADGVHYHFIAEKRFEALRARDELLEWAEIYGHYYGTPAEPVEQALSAGRDMLFDIDWQGAQQLCEKARADVVGVFVLPPSAGELRARLERRAEDSAEVILSRFSSARTELDHWQEYDYVIVNQDLEESLDGLRAILAAERLRRERRAGLADFVRSIQAEL